MDNSRERLEKILLRLAKNPPQTLLLEGGTETGRFDLALLWAKILNCPSSRDGNGLPCGACAVCNQIDAHEYLDLHMFDGRIANRADEESPGPIRALTIDNMRELKAGTATAPHGDGLRVAIFQGMIQTREEALNSLLKTLEDPSPHTRFVLLAPQRTQLLPTLVSRSLCLVLPWPGSGHMEEDMKEWEESLGGFLKNGRGFLENIGKKGAVDAALAARIVVLCQRALVRTLSGTGSDMLAKTLEPLGKNAEKAQQAARWIAEAQAMLAATVAPARVLEGFCANLFALLHEAA